MGNISKLANSIKEQGLLQPVGINDNNELIFGQRRIKAAISLGWEEIEVRRVNVTSILEGELTENEVRKQFNIEERVAIGKAVEDLLGERRGGDRKSEQVKNQSGQTPTLINNTQVENQSANVGTLNNKTQVEENQSANVGVLKNNIETRDIAAKKAGFGSHGTYAKAKTIIEKATPEQLKKVNSGESSINEVYTKIKKKEKIETARKKIAEEVKEKPNPPVIIHDDCKNFTGKCDLLITDPPYMTDVEDINEFAQWLPEKLQCVKKTGFAFVFIGAYPEELNAYLNIAMPEQVLVWTYRNTLGAAPKNKYKLNWQAILFYRMPDSPGLDCPITNELWAVQDINAPDGRHEGRYHAWEKPIKLAERLIRHTTKAGDTILDCYAGTGTFLLAGASLGRKTIGYETSKEMIDIAIKRGCQIG